MRPRAVGTLCVSWLTSLLGCTSEPADAPATDSTDIVGGEADPGDPAVVAINIEATGFTVCTGTLIAPDVILTAGHCPLDHVWLRQGSTVRSSGFWNDHLDVRASAKHPSFAGEGKPYDVALVQLTRPLADIGPIALSAAPLSNADVGKTVRHIGYGTTGDDWKYVKQIATGGVKRQASYPLTKVDDFFVWSGAPRKQTCLFDSGGPTLLNVDGIERIIGVVSNGPNCTDDGYDSRVDRGDILAWIDAQLAAWNTKRPPSP